MKTTDILTYVDDTLTKSTTYRGEITAAPGAEPNKSITLFSGNEGEEKAQRTFH